MKPIFSIVSDNTISITLPTGQKFEIVVKNSTDYIQVFASTNFGSSLSIEPMTSNTVKIKSIQL